MCLSAVPRIRGIPQRMPVRDSIDAIGKRLILRLLQPSPNEMLYVVIQRVDLGLGRMYGLERRQERRLSSRHGIARNALRRHLAAVHKLPAAVLIIFRKKQLPMVTIMLSRRQDQACRRNPEPGSGLLPLFPAPPVQGVENYRPFFFRILSLRPKRHRFFLIMNPPALSLRKHCQNLPFPVTAVYGGVGAMTGYIMMADHLPARFPHTANGARFSPAHCPQSLPPERAARILPPLPSPRPGPERRIPLPHSDMAHLPYPPLQPWIPGSRPESALLNNCYRNNTFLPYRFFHPRLSVYSLTRPSRSQNFAILRRKSLLSA